MHTFRLGSRLQFQLQDILAVMVGYGDGGALLSRLLARSRSIAPWWQLAGAGLYLWLGMAMSGPITLLRRRARPASGSAQPGSTIRSVAAYTWAELRVDVDRYVLDRARVLRDSGTLARIHGGRHGLLRAGSVRGRLVLLVLFGLKSTAEHEATHAWTHNVAVVISWRPGRSPGSP